MSPAPQPGREMAATSPQEVAAAVRAAGAAGVSCFRSSACGHLHVELRTMRRLRFFEPGDLTVGCDAGMTAAELDQVLAPARQWVPLDLPALGDCTLGAILSRHRSGPLRQRYGTVRDFTIGLEMVSAQARLVHCGGRVVKNVAGYDWMKLAIGARGALGIITGVNFKVYPRPQAFLGARFGGLDWEQIERLRAALLRSPLRPLAMELLAHAGQRSVGVRCAGSERVLARCRAELEGMARAARCQVAFSDDIEFEHPRAGDHDWSAPPAQALASLRALEAQAEGVRIGGRLGLGVYWVRGARPPAPPLSPSTAAWMARLKAELDPERRMHGEDCA